mmetsp:Transcript_17136/g.37476  ORF Transcript_17136/g.37476 Transcript_17136/m.37476 type:complete len:399 (+) Transcript_17136:169-1365(+)
MSSSTIATKSKRRKHENTFRCEKSEKKRRRVTKNDRDDRTYPDSVGSSFRGSNPAVIVDASANTKADGGVPSSKDISKELGKLDDRSSRTNALRALKQLHEWLAKEKKTTESSSGVLENFHCYGGVARALDFLEDNIDDMDCVMSTAAVIAELLSFRWNGTEQIREVAIEMAKTIVRRNGIQLLLRSNQELGVGHRASSATKNIWIAIGRTINGEETRCIINKKQKLSILSDATDCIFRLEEIGSSDTWTADVLQVVLYAIANTIKDNSIRKEDLKRVDIVPGCLRVLKRDEDWNRNDDVVTYALGILTICTKQKMLIRKKDFEELLPMLIHCMSHFRGNGQIRSFLFTLLTSACEKLPKKTMEQAGVLEAISALLKPEGLSEEVKEKARSIMRTILN